MKGLLLALALLTAIPADAGILVGAHSRGELAVHGRWIWVADVGDVWVPSVHVTWQPYVNGHWVWSPWGWMWVSHDPWGYVTDHYGRWLWTPHHGWVWVPGRVWAPAWVVWISGPGWIGWSPAPPDWYDGYWRRPDYHRHHHRWVVVHDRGFLSTSLADERLPDHRVKTDLVRALDYRDKNGFSRTAPIREAVERVTGRQAPVVRERQGTVRTPDPERPLVRRGKVAGPFTEPERARPLERDKAPTREPERDEAKRSPEGRSLTPARPAGPVRDERAPTVRERQTPPASPHEQRPHAPARSRGGEGERAGAAGRTPRTTGEGRTRR